MHRLWKYRLPLILAVIGWTSPEFGWASDPMEIGQQAESQQPSVAPTATPNTASGVVPTNFMSMTDWRDSLEDSGDAIPRSNLHERMQHLHQNCFLFRTTCLGRSHQRTLAHVRADRNIYESWHWYIRGHGPVVWVRN